MTLKKAKFGCLLLIFSPALAFALPSDRQQIAHLAADRVDLNQLTHSGTYHGNVQFEQGTTHLSAHKVMTQGDKNNRLIYAQAQGLPTVLVHYSEKTSPKKPLLHAYAQVIHYYPQRNVIKLIGQARIVQGSNSFSAPTIIYDTVKQHVVSESQGTKRTKIIIYPGKKL